MRPMNIVFNQTGEGNTQIGSIGCGPEWVRTADRLPLNLENELVVIDGKITLGLYDHNCWFFYNEDKNKWQMDEYDRVTHWMPLPKLPEVEG